MIDKRTQIRLEEIDINYHDMVGLYYVTHSIYDLYLTSSNVFSSVPEDSMAFESEQDAKTYVRILLEQII